MSNKVSKPLKQKKVATTAQDTMDKKVSTFKSKGKVKTYINGKKVK